MRLQELIYESKMGRLYYDLEWAKAHPPLDITPPPSPPGPPKFKASINGRPWAKHGKLVEFPSEAAAWKAINGIKLSKFAKVVVEPIK